MFNIFFILGFGMILALILWWSFKTLPDERWQVMFSMPLRKKGDDQWYGLNLTYYGFFVACSNTLAVTLIVILLGSLGVPLKIILVIAASLLVVVIPASKISAFIVEKKSSTLSVGGAAFVGIILAPWILMLLQQFFITQMGHSINVLAILSAIAISYAFGEATGRLACISFGCCYGKPISKIHPLMQRLFKPLSFTFTGKTKKIAYAHGLDCQKVVPIQAITSIIYISSGLVAMYLFVTGSFRSAFLLAISTTQLWRFISEFLRADYRGKGKISAYQIMGIIAFVYTLFITFFFQNFSPAKPDIMMGLDNLWNPSVIVSLQIFWIIIFLFTGRSQVTGSTISFHVVKEKI